MIGADWFIDKVKPELQAKHATQRYLHGISDVDMWDFDGFIADSIVHGCQWMIDHGHSHPHHLTVEQWHDVLGRIKTGFNRARLGGQVSDEAWVLLREHFRYFWD